jgi:hypothetical protein
MVPGAVFATEELSVEAMKSRNKDSRYFRRSHSR